MLFDSILRLARRWRWLLIAYAVGALVMAVASSFVTQPAYVASTTVVVNGAWSADAPSEYSSLLSGEHLANTYASILSSRQLIDRAVIALGSNEPVGQVQKRFKAQIVTETGVIVLTFEDSSPELATAMVDEIYRQFRSFVDLHKGSQYTSTSESINQQLDSLNSNMGADQAQLSGLASQPGDTSATRQKLLADLEHLRGSYKSLLASYLNLQLLEANGQGSLVASDAEASTIPVRPHMVQDVLAALPLAALLAVLIAFVVERLDTTVRWPWQITNTVGVRVLATMAHSETGAPHAPVPAFIGQGAQVEEFQRLQNALNLDEPGTAGRTLLVAPAGRGIDQYQTAAHLAVSIAASGKRVVIVDADLKHPSLHALFGCNNLRGLSTALVHIKEAVSAGLLPTRMPRLLLLPAGRASNSPLRLLQPARLAAIVAELNAVADVTIVLSPPVERSGEVAQLAHICGDVLLVVKARKTTLLQLQNAYKLFAQSGAQLRGAALVDAVDGLTPVFASSYDVGGKPGRKSRLPGGSLFGRKQLENANQ